MEYEGQISIRELLVNHPQFNGVRSVKLVATFNGEGIEVWNLNLCRIGFRKDSLTQRR